MQQIKIRCTDTKGVLKGLLSEMGKKKKENNSFFWVSSAVTLKGASRHLDSNKEGTKRPSAIRGKDHLADIGGFIFSCFRFSLLLTAFRL